MASFRSSMRPGRLPDDDDRYAICSGCSTVVSTGPGRELVVMVGTVRIALLGVVVVAALMTAASGAAGRRGGRTRRRRGRRARRPVALDAPDRRLSRSPERDLQTVVWLPATDAAALLIVLAHGYNGHPRKFSEPRPALG